LGKAIEKVVNANPQNNARICPIPRLRDETRILRIVSEILLILSRKFLSFAPGAENTAADRKSDQGPAMSMQISGQDSFQKRRRRKWWRIRRTTNANHEMSATTKAAHGTLRI